MKTVMQNDSPLKESYKILFIIFVVLGVYYPSIFSGFNSVDDVRIIDYLENTDSTFLEILLPGRSHYYRPVIWLTYFFDKFAWALDPGFMHLENILFHAGNAVLVYLVAGRLYSIEEHRLQLPLLAALLFSVHPINTEAICWIAGRTDPLATLFILAAAYVLASPEWSQNRGRLLLPAGLIFLGCLAKEIAFFFFPIAVLMTLSRSHSDKAGTYSWRTLFCNALPFAFFSLLYLYLRQSGLKGEDTSVALLVSQKANLFEAFITALTAFGFYVKKLFLPLPLNFAIVSYHHNYLWLGAAVLLLLIWALIRKKACYFLLGIAFFLISPAVLITVKLVAWTPVAERYLYAPNAFFCIAVIGLLYYYLKEKWRLYPLPVFLMILIISSAYLTVERNLIWQDNYLLYKDAVAQSPGFPRIRNELGIALAGKGRNDEANIQLKVGKKIYENFYQATLNLAVIKFRENKSGEALAILDKYTKDNKKDNFEILQFQAIIYESLLLKSRHTFEKRKNLTKLISTYNSIYLINRDPYMAYRVGQLHLSLAEPEKAAGYFEIAAREAPDGSFYKDPAGKLAQKLRTR